MNLEIEIASIANSLGYMPSRSDLDGMGRGDLSSRIQKTGGFIKWAIDLGFPNKKPTKIWSDDLIESELVKSSKFFGEMPSSNLLIENGLSALSSQISRNGGFDFWAKKIGLERKHSDSDTGWDGEIELKNILLSKGFSCERTIGNKAPYDLILDECIKIDVKSTSYSEYGACKGWFYRIGKYAQADIIALFELDTKNVYFIPWFKCPKTNITISSGGGKYSKYLNNFDNLKQISKKRLEENIIWD